MSTTPIPSSSAEDFKLNAEDFDAFANGTGSYTDRFGNSRLSLSQFMESIGYEVPVAFTTSLSITRVTQTVTESGNTYHARADAIPFTTNGVFNAAQWDLIVSNPVEVSTHAATSKSTPVDADELPLVDSAASFGLKKLTLANLKATLKTYFDTLYHPIGSYLSTTGGTMTGLLKFAAGSSIASAATVNLSTATGNTVHVTGTTGISAWTMTAGQIQNVIFDGVMTLTHHATNNNLPGAANITTAAGDRATLYYDGTTVYMFNYTRAAGTALVSSGGNQIMSLAAVVSASGTSVDFTGIPSWAKKITLQFAGLSTNGSSIICLRLGTSGGFDASGYNGSVYSAASSAGLSELFTTGLALHRTGMGSASVVRNGIATFTLIGSNQWAGVQQNGHHDTAVMNSAGCARQLSGVLDRIRLTTVNGTDTFDTGTVSILIEGY